MNRRFAGLISVIVILSNLLPFNVLAAQALTSPPALPAPVASASRPNVPVNLWANPAFVPGKPLVPDEPAVLPDVKPVAPQPASAPASAYPMFSLFDRMSRVGPRPFSEAGPVAEPETVTDAAGQYRFTGLEKGTHKVTFDPASLPLNLQPAGAETTPTLWINPGETLVSEALSTGVRITAFYNATTGDVSGEVFWDADGDGRQSAGEPGLAGVTVIDPTLHQYFVPFDDRNLWELFEGKAECHNIGDSANLPMVSNIFVTASNDGTVYYYDHWEDGYDPDPLNPGATTQVGILDAGATQLFQSNINPALVGSAPYYYDGRDRITIFGESANVIRRVNASSYTLTGDLQSNSGGWLAGAWEIPEVADWDQEYIATVGEDLNYGTGQDGASDFDFTGLSVTARQDGTVVSYIHAHDGSIVTYTLDAGEVVFIDGADDGPNGLGVDSRDRVSASAPVQVQMLAGACSSEIVSADGYTMQPVDKWDTTYWAPVPGFDPICLDPDAAFDDADTDIYLHNPHSYNIVVTVHSNDTIVRSLTIPANSTISILHETGWDDLATGIYGTYITSDETFWGISAVDSATDGATGADDWDWGYSLIPQSELSSQVIVGYAPGRPVDATSGSLNGNMAFVIAVTDTTIFVDLNQDRIADAFDMNGDGDALDDVFGVAAWDEPGSNFGIPLAAGQVLRIGDPVDYNLVGARIYTPDPSQKIAVAWGQDPCAADYLIHEDMGYTIFPHPVPSFSKVDELAIDSDATGDITPGDILTYTMVIFNNGFGELSNAVLTDSLPYTYSSFVVGSMDISAPPALGGIEYSNDGVDFSAPESTGIQAFRITWPVIASFQSVTVTFLITLNNTIPETVTQITNQAVVGADNHPPVSSEDPDDPPDPDTDTPIGRPNLSLAKAASAEVITPGQSFTYTIIAANTGTGVAVDFSLTDSLPPHLQYVPDSLNLTWPVARVFTTTRTVTHTRSDGTQYVDVIVTRQTELVYTTITGGNPLDYAATPMVITNGLRLPGGGVITAAFRVTAAAPLTNGLELVNAATISASNWATPTVATVPVRITASHVLSITKTDDPDPVIPGEVLTYTMVYSAAGNEPAPDTIITDTTPPSTTFVAAYGGLSVVAPPPGATGLITWALGTLLPPAGGVVTMVVRVDPDRVDPLLNYVRISDRTGAHADDDEPTALLFADVAIRKIVEPAEAVAAGDVITWTLVYSNEGQVAAQNVTLTDVLPAGVTFGGVVRTTPVLPAPVIASPTLTWTLPAPLAVNASGSIVLTATVNAGYPYLTNTVVIRTTTPETNTTNNQDNTTTPVVGLAIHKEVLASPVQVGEAVSYRIAVTNTGEVALARVPLTDTYESAYLRFESASPSQSALPLVGMIVWDNIGPLAVGASARVAVTFTAVASTAVGYASPNEAAASGQTAGGRSTGPVTDTARVEIRAPELRLRKTSQNEGGYPAYPGEVLTYTLAVSNVGLGVATNVVVRDRVPAGTSYVAGSIRGGDSRSDAGLPELAWTVNRLDAGEGVTVSFAVRLNGDLGDGTSVVNTGSVTSTEVITPVRSTVTDTVDVPRVGLAIHKEVLASPVQVGEAVSYRIAVTNTGEVALARVPLTDTYESAYLRFESASPSQSALPLVGMIVWDNIGPLAVGASARVAVTFTAVASTAVGYASPNEAVASGQTAGGRSTGPVTDTARVEIRAPELRLRKTSQNEGGYPAYPGEVLTYTLAVSNVGLGVATNVVVRDRVPAGTSYVAGSIRGGDSRSDAGLPELAWTVNRLDAGEGVTVSFAVRLNGDLGDGTSVVNTGSVTSTEVITPVRSTVTDTVTSPAPAPDLPGLTASKRVTISPNVYSSTVRYTVNVTNTGDVAFSALRLTDTLPEGLIYAGNAFPIAPTSINGQVLRWNDVLVPPYNSPFLPTQVITVSYDVRVTTRIPGQYQNSITATGVYTTGELTATAHTPLTVADPAIALDKALVPPGVVNGLVTYTIRLTNTGPSILDVVPLFDVYDAGYLKFLRATPTENLSTTGHIQWSDLTAPGPNGFGVNMIPGQTFVITTAFEVIKEITETITNTARAQGVIDIFGNPVGPVKDDVPINEGAPPGAPNAVTLLYFRAVAANNAVTLRWATSAEVDNRGFGIWRSPAENPADVAQLAFIAAQGTGTGGGYSYQYSDKTVMRGQAYTYWLADVDYNGVETRHGPVTLSLDRFSKVYLPVLLK